MTTERSPSTKRTRLSASCLVGAVRLLAEAVRRMTYVLPPWWITHWSARSSVDCAGRSPSALWTRRRRSSGWPSGSSSWGCLVRLRCASAGCLLLRRSLSASSALSSSFVTILSLISSHSPGLSTAKVRKTWRSPQVRSLRSSSRSAWSNMLTMVIGMYSNLLVNLNLLESLLGVSRSRGAQTVDTIPNLSVGPLGPCWPGLMAEPSPTSSGGGGLCCFGK